MAENSIAPAFIKVRYTTETSGAHNMLIPVIPFGAVTPGEEPELVINLGGSKSCSGFVGDLVGRLAEVYAAGSVFNGWEFWSKPEPEDDPVFIYGESLNLDGEGVSAEYAYGQAVFTFRTAAGGIVKCYLMESQFTPNLRVPLSPVGSDFINDFTEWFLGADNCWVGRDGARPIYGLYLTTKFNDALRRKGLS
jgi:hypothetical protein